MSQEGAEAAAVAREPKTSASSETGTVTEEPKGPVSETGADGPVAKEDGPMTKEPKTSESGKEPVSEEGPVAKTPQPSESGVSSAGSEGLAVGGMQVECVRCGKWRVLERAVDPLELAEDWECGAGAGWDGAGCEVAETGPEKDELYVETPDLGPGSVVWARLQGWPFWPALLTYDSESRQLFTLVPGSTPPRIKAYHVRFFGPKSSTAWVGPKSLLFHRQDPRELKGQSGRRVREVWAQKAFAVARQQATDALAIHDIPARLLAHPNPMVPLSVRPKLLLRIPKAALFTQPGAGKAAPAKTAPAKATPGRPLKSWEAKGWRKPGRKPGVKNGVSKAQAKAPKAKAPKAPLAPTMGIEEAIEAVLAADRELAEEEEQWAVEGAASQGTRIAATIDAVRLSVAFGEYHHASPTKRKGLSLHRLSSPTKRKADDLHHHHTAPKEPKKTQPKTPKDPKPKVKKAKKAAEEPVAPVAATDGAEAAQPAGRDDSELEKEGRSKTPDQENYVSSTSAPSKSSSQPSEVETTVNVVPKPPAPLTSQTVLAAPPKPAVTDVVPAKLSLPEHIAKKSEEPVKKAAVFRPVFAVKKRL